MSQITKIPLSDQVLAVLRVRRVASIYDSATSEQIATQLDRPRSEILRVLNDLYNLGHISQQHVTGSESTYRVTPNARRTNGCCCCCDAKLIATDTIFCQTCGPEFSGRV